MQLLVFCVFASNLCRLNSLLRVQNKTDIFLKAEFMLNVVIVKAGSVNRTWNQTELKAVKDERYDTNNCFIFNYRMYEYPKVKS